MVPRNLDDRIVAGVGDVDASVSSQRNTLWDFARPLPTIGFGTIGAGAVIPESSTTRLFPLSAMYVAACANDYTVQTNEVGDDYDLRAIGFVGAIPQFFHDAVVAVSARRSHLRSRPPL